MAGYVEPLSLDYSLIFFAQIFFMQKKKKILQWRNQNTKLIKPRNSPHVLKLPCLKKKTPNNRGRKCNENIFNFYKFFINSS